MPAENAAIPAIFQFDTEGDVAVDPKTLVLWLRQSGLGLPSKDYYMDAEVVAVYTEIIRASLKSIYGGLEESADFKELAEGVVDLEKAIAKVGLDVCVGFSRLALTVLIKSAVPTSRILKRHTTRSARLSSTPYSLSSRSQTTLPPSRLEIGRAHV